MKSKIILLVYLSMVFVSCKQEIDPDPDVGYMNIQIVHFKNPAYANNLIVTGNLKDLELNNHDLGGEIGGMLDKYPDHFIFFSYNGCDPDLYQDDNLLEIKDFNERYRGALWPLTDGWYLIDWAWGNGTLSGTIYPQYGTTILLDVSWNDYKDYSVIGNQFLYNRTLNNITKRTKDIYTLKSIYISDLVHYFYPDGNYPSFEARSWDSQDDAICVYSNQYLYHKAFYKKKMVYSDPCLCDRADELDEYWTLLQTQLTTIINNGDLNKLKSFSPTHFNIGVE